ncbi:uncharacterized protein LOC124164140 isoform X2 [Ischnura elegans]|nr:uncharacterized protein LOC124164140 isoform X2 [Ischnura elegans]
MDLSKFHGGGHHHVHAHDCVGNGATGLSRVVMVRKTEQRTFASGKSGEEPKYETVTRETVETFGAGKTQRRVTTLEKRDLLDEPPDDLRAVLRETKLNGTNKPKPVSVVNKSKIPTATNGTSKPDLIKQGDSKLSWLKPKPKAEQNGDGDGVHEEDTFEQDCLRAHNEFRQKHGVPPLKLNKKICKFSEEWAKRLAARGHIEHRVNCEYGENIFLIWSTNPDFKVTGREPVENWYSEIKEHTFGQEPTNLKSGHFTQVVWKDSAELGVAMAKSRKGQVFVVANYYPPGNYIGSYVDNVLPLIGTCSGVVTPVKNGSTPTEELKSPTVASGSQDEEFAKEGLRLHNEFRRKHGVPELKLSLLLNDYSKQWAKTLAREDSMRHRTNGKYGENLFYIFSSNTNLKSIAQEACNAWYKEIKEHTFGVEPRTLRSGHFSQMIWKTSEELGFSMEKSRTGKVYVVANYNPRGNYIGQFSANVPPKI